MTRSFRVWMFACALLSALAVSARAQDCAKPPDLPVDPNDTIPLLTPPSLPEVDEMPTPVVPLPEPMPGWPIITIQSSGSPYYGCYDGPGIMREADFGEPSTLTIYPGKNGVIVGINQNPVPKPRPLPGWPIITLDWNSIYGVWDTGGETVQVYGDPKTTLTIYPGENGVIVGINPEPTPQTVTISHPVRPRMPLSVQRTFDECLLIGAHPLLSLVPLPESLREERHTQEMVPVALLPQPQFNGVVTVTPDLSIPIAPNSFYGGEQQSNQPEPIRQMPQPQETHDPAPCQVCPYHGPCDRHVEAIGDEDIAHSVMANLEKLLEAEQFYETACKMAESGHYADAMKCVEKASGLCSPGRFEDMKLEVVSHILSCVICGGHGDNVDAEESDEPPTECLPDWFGGDDDGPAQKPPQQAAPTSEGSGCCHNPEHCGSTPMCQCKTPAMPMMERKLMTPVSVSFKDVPLQQVIDDLRQSYDLNLAIDAASLKGINFDRTVTLELVDICLKTILDVVLKKYDLGYIIKDDFIVITTRTIARGSLIDCTYFVGDLVGCHAKTCKTTEELLTLITSTIEPSWWSANGGSGDIEFVPNSQTLVIHQFAVIHEQVADLLDALRRLENEKCGCGQRAVSDHGCGMSCKEPGVAEQVAGLMKACHLALGCGDYAKAAQLACEAHALDAERVAADPVVYKMHLLAEHKDKGCCCCPDDCCCGDQDCCCPQKLVVTGGCVMGGILVNNMPAPAVCCPLVQMQLPSLPPVDATVVVELQKLLDEKAETATAKPALEVVEEESESHEAPKAVAKPFRVQMATTGMVISFDEMLKFIPGETWTEFDPTTNHVRALYRVRVGNAVYCVRYDGELSVDLSVTPSTGCGEKCEEHK